MLGSLPNFSARFVCCCSDLISQYIQFRIFIHRPWKWWAYRYHGTGPLWCNSVACNFYLRSSKLNELVKLIEPIWDWNIKIRIGTINITIAVCCLWELIGNKNNYRKHERQLEFEWLMQRRTHAPQTPSLRAHSMWMCDHKLNDSVVVCTIISNGHVRGSECSSDDGFVNHKIAFAAKRTHSTSGTWRHFIRCHLG